MLGIYTLGCSCQILHCTALLPDPSGTGQAFGHVACASAKASATRGWLCSLPDTPCAGQAIAPCSEQNLAAIAPKANSQQTLNGKEQLWPCLLNFKCVCPATALAWLAAKRQFVNFAYPYKYRYAQKEEKYHTGHRRPVGRFKVSCFLCAQWKKQGKEDQ